MSQPRTLHHYSHRLEYVMARIGLGHWSLKLYQPINREMVFGGRRDLEAIRSKLYAFKRSETVPKEIRKLLHHARSVIRYSPFEAQIHEILCHEKFVRDTNWPKSDTVELDWLDLPGLEDYGEFHYHKGESSGQNKTLSEEDYYDPRNFRRTRDINGTSALVSGGRRLHPSVRLFSMPAESFSKVLSMSFKQGA